ncbi:MAG: DUF3305 domain-containing protein [Pseudomonadota bacterium]|nr:MAG: DUF3305 domain-containing protein [Pseudomonadota bacterium]
MATSEAATPVIAEVPVGVVTVHETVSGNPWINERWRVVGVLAGETLGTTRGRRSIRRGQDSEEFLWTGLTLRLTPVEADSYYHNLIGRAPAVYVKTQAENDGEPIPIQVSIEYIEALAFDEAGNDSHAVPMPPDIYRIVERFVLEHYVPEEPRMKRKRDAPSSDDSGHGPRCG